MNTIPFQISGKKVIVTGGGSGIGKQVALQFANQEAEVIIISRTEKQLRKVAAHHPGQLFPVTADLSRREGVEDALQQIISHWSQIDVLVNAAGAICGTSTQDPLIEAEESWQEDIGNNLTSSYFMSHVCAPYMARPGGRMINISSIAAFTGGRRPGAMSYAAAKSGLTGLTFALARELSPEGITANVIAPGFIADTDFTAHWPEVAIQGIVRETPVGRPGHVSDIAAAVQFLASDEASFITGEILHVNGGWTFGY
ncbi:SDR family NAD(P)-dependent oxidoreductase [Desmospora profundinema]|uniref:3-oxoacyl-[acyl-carrier protein] reductase n=1 Tax=Desmospora profundinema TaxID=1571184 RepID=A0ABU1IPZ0_9BACL|nr:SDR family oxidoreductase [Desmospora profundinema]MDR6226473.1 3-oxoacyl-[acyl-carrier protein] reductase [Desmospora profundinema]